ncbi:MAG: nucleoside recognition protein [Desulfobacterales bacterium]|nr:nucleoside recognition protein [Desulfobacterales bacterium]
MQTLSQRIAGCIRAALPKALKLVLWLLKIMLPISLAVSLLHHWGVIASVAGVLTPAFALIGLPGEAAVVFITSILVNIYAAIAVIATLPLDLREVTILALMCLISHNLPVETLIQKKTRSSALGMLALRLTTSFVAAVALDALLPAQLGAGLAAKHGMGFANLGQMLLDWLAGAAWLVLKITLIVTGLMILQNLLKEFNIIKMLSRLFAPLMRLLGLSRESSFLWLVAQILGLAYGSAIMIDAVERNEISAADANRLNYHIAINHSLLEDTLLFVAIGVPAVWITFPRIALAIIVVWGVRAVVRLRPAKAGG